MTAVVDKPTAAAEPKKSAPVFYQDVEGLRGVAVVVVVLFHASVPFMDGAFVGLDMFFVISGFLITGLLVREFEKTQTISFRQFYARRARRILPSAALVIVATSVAVWFVLPLLGVFRQAFDLLAAAVYMANWRFIAQGKDYLAGGSGDSVATHFWSLSVEEQFYFVWPIVILLSGLLARRRGWSIKVVVGTVVTLLTAVSLVASVSITAGDPALSYMATHTRAWQFGVGGMLAVLAPTLGVLAKTRHARTLAVVLGWIGFAAVFYCGATYDHATPYPGFAAFYPTVGGALVIAAGVVSIAPGTVGSFLINPVWRWLGRVSYAWYLWHWPVLVLYQVQFGPQGWPTLVALMGGALVLGWLTTELFDKPIMTSPELKRNLTASISLGITGTVLAAAATMGLGILSIDRATQDLAQTPTSVSFESVFGAGTGTLSGPVVPSPFQAYDDRPGPDECLLDGPIDTPDTCVFGPEDGTPVVLMGDSHAHQCLPAFQEVLVENHWRLYVRAKAACPVQNLQAKDGRTDRFAQPDCAQWRDGVMAEISALTPRYVFVTSLSAYIPDYQELKQAWDESLTDLRASGASLVYIKDSPYPQLDIPECMSGNIDDWTACDFDLENSRRTEPIVTDQLRGENLDIPVLDFNGFLCDGTLCHAARNGTLLYRDDSHLTATASRALGPALRQELIDAGVTQGDGTG